MNLNLALIAFALTCGSTIALVVYRLVSAKQKKVQSVEDFLLGGKTLDRTSVINLLLSSSFGVNALFYAIWLGYTVGIWGLVIQAAWAISFLLLTPFAKKLRSGNSLHDFLGNRFGVATKILAAICSLVGLMYLMGWEVAIGEGAFNLLLPSSGHASSAFSPASLLIAGIVLGTLTYTILGGLRGNAIVDKLLNGLKVVFVGLLTVLLLHHFFWAGNNSFMAAMFPSFKTMVVNLGIWGLITNVIFNLSWQFVDNSSWQSIIAGGEKKNKDTVRNLRLSSLAIFLTIGLFGTLIGVALVGSPGISPDNVLSQAIQLLPGNGALLTFGMFVVIIACIMSLLDGLFLASSLTLLTDLLQLKKDSVWNKAAHNPKRKLLIMRLSLVLIAFIAVYGVKFIFNVTGASLFDFVYIVIITQLALFGPVIIGLATNRVRRRSLWLAIAIALVVGFGSIFLGISKDIKFLVDGAGTFALLASTVMAFALTKRAGLASRIEQHRTM